MTMVSEGAIQVSKEDKTLIYCYVAYEPQQWSIWHINPKGLVVTCVPGGLVL